MMAVTVVSSSLTVRTSGASRPPTKLLAGAGTESRCARAAGFMQAIGTAVLGAGAAPGRLERSEAKQNEAP